MTKRKLRSGLTIAEYDALLASQGGVCGVCGNPPKTRRFHVDHDHATGLVRGLLCFYDNYRVIGRHTLDRLRKAVKYLERHGRLQAATKSNRSTERSTPARRRKEARPNG